MQKTGMTGENFTACLNNLPNSALKKDVIFCIGQLSMVSGQVRGLTTNLSLSPGLKHNFTP